jgi:DNA-directed RNA polymerase subunit N (RpoN/RPB10)
MSACIWVFGVFFLTHHPKIGGKLLTNSSRMLPPIRCMNCGKVIADQWRFYQKKLKELKGDAAEQKYYFDGTSVPETPEKKILDGLGVMRLCCRKHFLTQVDLIEKI